MITLERRTELHTQAYFYASGRLDNNLDIAYTPETLKDFADHYVAKYNAFLDGGKFPALYTAFNEWQENHK